MARQIIATVLTGLLLSTPLIAQSTNAGDKHARFAQRVKDGVRTLGTGPDASVRVSLKDKTRLSGYIRQAGEDSFEVVNAKTGLAATVPYTEVRKLRGHNVSVGSTFSPVEIAMIGAVIFSLALPIIILKTMRD